MKKIITLIFSFISVLSFCNADLGWFIIDDYTADFKLREDWILEIVEKIKVNFSEDRHWIYRTIPYIYSTYKKTPIENVEIPWYKFTTKAEWKNFVIKIWDANRTVRWINNYTIQYQIKWTVRNFDGYQELYWNMLWTEWNTPINNFNFSLELPSDLNLKSNEIWVYIWEKWSNNTTKAIKSWNIISNPKPLKLWAREWVTLAVKLPTDYVPTKRYYSFRGIAIISIWSLITFLVFWFSSSELIKRYKIRKSLAQTHWKKLRDIVYYTPPKWYSAMEVATIYHWKSNFDIFSSYLYTWISDGYVCIEEDEPKFLYYKFEKWFRLKKEFWKQYIFKPTTNQPKFDELDDKPDFLHFSNPEFYFWQICFVNNDINNLKDFEEEDTEFLKKISDEVFYRIHTRFIPNWKDLYKVKRLSSSKYKFKDSFLKKIFGAWYNNGRYIRNWIIWIFLIIFTYLMFFLFTGNQDLLGYLRIFLFWILCLFIIRKSWLWVWLCVLALIPLISIAIIVSSILKLISFGKLDIFSFGESKSSYISKYKTYWNDLNYITEEWIEAIEQILWFRKYLLSVDDNKLRTLLKEDPTYFEKNLPYAIALDVWDHRIKKCIHILEEMDYSPKWISVSDDNWWDAITSMSTIWNSISSTVDRIDHPHSGWGGGWDSWDRWSSSGWSDGWWSSGWWWGWGWWWSW